NRSKRAVVGLDPPRAEVGRIEVGVPIRGHRLGETLVHRVGAVLHRDLSVRRWSGGGGSNRRIPTVDPAVLRIEQECSSAGMAGGVLHDEVVWIASAVKYLTCGCARRDIDAVGERGDLRYRRRARPCVESGL